MRRHIAGIALGLLAATSGARAEPLAMMGIGLTSCRQIAADLKPELGFTHTPNVLVYVWAQGYMSAANMVLLEGGSEYVDLTGYDMKAILPAIQAFCAKNPDKKPVSLIDVMIEQADRRKGVWPKGTIGWAAD
jgi:hypothetical protein